MIPGLPVTLQDAGTCAAVDPDDAAVGQAILEGSLTGNGDKVGVGYSKAGVHCDLGGMRIWPANTRHTSPLTALLKPLLNSRTSR